MSTLAAMTVPLHCGISYYGGGIAPSPYNPGLLGRLNELKAPMLSAAAWPMTLAYLATHTQAAAKHGTP